MRKLACTGCGAPLDWDGVSPVVTCMSCGSRFQMNVGRSTNNWQAEALRGNCVAERPCLDRSSNNGSDFGKSYYRCWLPQGWTYRVGCASFDRAGSVATPLVPTIVLMAPDQRSFIVHTTSNAFQDPGSGLFGNMGGGIFGNMGRSLGSFGQSGQVDMNGNIHFPTCIVNPQTFTRYRQLIPAAADCDEIVQLDHPGAMLVSERQPDDIVHERLNQMLAGVPEQVRQSLWFDWASRIYRFEQNGVPFLFLVEVQISTNGFNRQQAQQAQQPRQGGFFARMMNAASQSMAQAGIPRVWRIDYEMSLTAPEAEFMKYMEEYDHVRKTIELGRDFAEMQGFYGNFMQREAMKNQQMMNNAQMQMAADRAASWDRRAAIIQDTNNYTTNVMRQMNANTAATHDRVAGMHSEMLREVNTYSGFGDRPVEADIRYDHVYGYNPVGGAPYEDAYLGVEGDWLTPGVDFVELPRQQ